MNRVIRSFNSLSEELLDLLQVQYPDGMDSTHIKPLTTSKGDQLRVIELRTDDTIYLIKIDQDVRQEIEEFLDTDVDDDVDLEDLDDDVGGEDDLDIDEDEVKNDKDDDASDDDDQ